MSFELGEIEPDDALSRERRQLTARAVQLLRGIVRFHADFSSNGQGAVMQLPTAPWP